MYNCPKTAKINKTKASGNTEGGHGSIFYKHFVYKMFLKYKSFTKYVRWLDSARLSEKNLGASWPPSFHFLSPEQVFWSPKIIFKN